MCGLLCVSTVAMSTCKMCKCSLPITLLYYNPFKTSNDFYHAPNVNYQLSDRRWSHDARTLYILRLSNIRQSDNLRKFGARVRHAIWPYNIYSFRGLSSIIFIIFLVIRMVIFKLNVGFRCLIIEFQLVGIQTHKIKATNWYQNDK